MLGADTTFADLRLPLPSSPSITNSGRSGAERRQPRRRRARHDVGAGVFEPVERDGYQLLDGGVLDNVPVAWRAASARKVIAVDVLPNFRLNQPGQDPIVPPLKTKKVPKAYRQFGTSSW
jgi:hypothetical protein